MAVACNAKNRTEESHFVDDQAQGQHSGYITGSDHCENTITKAAIL